MVVENMDPEKIMELCESYSKFLKIDISRDVKSTAEIIEETLTRMEEFLSFMVMVQDEFGDKQVESLLMRKQELNAIEDLIDRLQATVAVVTQCINEVEACLVKAEMETDSNKGPLLNFLKPFFKKDDLEDSDLNTPKFEPPEIFKTSDLFPQQSEENNK